VEVVNLLRVLWARRLFVIAVGLFSLLIGVYMTFQISPSGLKTRQYHVGIAASQVLFDTPDSQIADLSPPGADALGARAQLLANLMATQPVQRLVAQKAGIKVSQLVTVAPAMSGATVSTLSVDATQAAAKPTSYVLTITADAALPLVTFSAQAPTADAAARLANAAEAGLRDYLASITSTTNVPQGHRYVIKELGGARAADVTRGPRKLMGAMVAFVLFAMGCGAIIAVTGIVRSWRAVAEAERHDQRVAAELAA
jgi:capsular polysaccharide biosynthesis protein